MHALDPTPRAIAHAATVTDPLFVFHAVGLWSEDTTLKFFEPADPTHVSHSVTNIQHTDGYFEAPCERVSTVLAGIGASGLDLLKLDIEGAEPAVLRDLLVHGPLPSVLCVEFDTDQPVRTTRRLIGRLRQ